MTKQQFMQTIPKREKLYLILSSKTRLPYAACNPETFNDENFYYTSKEKAIAKAEELKAAGIQTMVAELNQSVFLNFFSQCYAQGINSLVFHDDDDEEYQIELTEFVKKRDPKDMPGGKAPAENPELLLSMIYYLQEARRDKETVQKNMKKVNELAEEALANLTRATYLVPMSAQGENEQGQKRYIPIHVTMKDNSKKPFLPIFTDVFEFQKCKKVINAENTALLPLKLDQIVDFLEKFKKMEDEHIAILDMGTLNLPLTLDNLKLVQRDFGEREE